MELIDAAFPLLHGVVATTDAAEACAGVEIACMVGGFPRRAGMERKDVMAKNVAIYKAAASSLEAHASPPDVKIVVVANPANTNAYVLKHFAPKIKKENISALTRLDHNRMLGMPGEKLAVPSTEVSASSCGATTAPRRLHEQSSEPWPRRSRVTSGGRQYRSTS